MTGAHYPALVGLLWFDSGGLKAFILIVVGIISFFAWIGAVRRWRLAGDTPSSKIGSAAQGFVEIVGVTESAQLLKDPVRDEPCVWFRIETWAESSGEHKSQQLIKSAESSRAFIVRDATGACEVSPQGAEFNIGDPYTYRDGSLEHRVWRIYAGNSLYVAGEFQTIGDRNVMHAPSDGRAYVISNRPQASSGDEYRRWAWVHLAFVFIGVLAAGWLASA